MIKDAKDWPEDKSIENLVCIEGGSGLNDGHLFKDLPWYRFSTLEDGSAYNPLGGNGDVYFKVDESQGLMFLPRHGPSEEQLLPHQTQFVPNYVVAKLVGANVVVGISAGGSLSKRIKTGDVVFPDSYVDETNRNYWPYPPGVIAHPSSRPGFSDPLRKVLIKYAKNHNGFQAVHKKGTVVVIPGPEFGTEAEGKKRAKYAKIVGMTQAETKTAIALNMHYASMVCIVDADYDANHGNTIQEMMRFSSEECLPAYLESILDPLKKFAKKEGTPTLQQLQGNVHAVQLDSIIDTDDHKENRLLRRIAQELKRIYLP